VDFLGKFLPSVMAHSADQADVWIVDNFSSDNSIDFIEKNFPAIRIVRLDKNYGFAKGYNMGVQQIPNETLVLLNSDVEVTANWIEPVVEYMNSNPGMAACQPKILDYNARDQFEYAGAAGGFIDRNGYAFCAGRIFNAFEKDHGQYAGNCEVFWASGAALFVKRDVLIDVGGLDEDFYAHMEEIDLCWRLKNRGYKIGACRGAAVFHVGGGTLTKENPFKTYLNFRNNLYLLIKNYRAGSLVFKLFKRLLLDGVAGLHFLSEGKVTYFKAVLRAHGSFYKNAGRFMSKRKHEEPFVKNPNLKGSYKGSIVRDFFIGGKRKFSDLDPRKFV
jgi:GT2 family glycosyltransferase